MYAIVLLNQVITVRHELFVSPWTRKVSFLFDCKEYKTPLLLASLWSVSRYSSQESDKVWEEFKKAASHRDNMVVWILPSVTLSPTHNKSMGRTEDRVKQRIRLWREKHNRGVFDYAPSLSWKLADHKRETLQIAFDPWHGNKWIGDGTFWDFGLTTKSKDMKKRLYKSWKRNKIAVRMKISFDKRICQFLQNS
jgi:hypothetical protein